MELTLDLTKQYTYADYLTWMDDKRRELFEGFIKMMCPAPAKRHQVITVNIIRILSNFLYKKKCKVFVAPFDVRFPKNGEKDGKKIYTVVQPDICVVCDHEKLDERGCLGAPDLIIEIVSENPKRDVKEKYALYEKYGVREYWIVFPYEQTIYVYLLDENGKYQNVGVYAEDELAKVNVLDDFYLDLKEVFEE